MNPDPTPPGAPVEPTAPDRAEEHRVDTPQGGEPVPTEGTDTGTPDESTNSDANDGDTSSDDTPDDAGSSEPDDGGGQPAPDATPVDGTVTREVETDETIREKREAAAATPESDSYPRDIGNDTAQ